ncbi:MAG: Pyruvate kinase [bacterium ADurb.Bin243]|nr:MAG: Pyruvate kinase [bacterium ADurb.Bin243]
MNNLTKIVCTIGPSCHSVEMIKKLIQRGMNVARMNFSHDPHELQLEKINMVRQASAELNSPVAILADIQGPKIRVAALEKPIELAGGTEVTVTTREGVSGPDVIPTIYKNLPHDVMAGSRILLDDGRLELRVLEVVSDTDVLCAVIKGGLLKSKKGINLPGVNVSAPAVTEKDLKDIEFVLEHDVDYIALSFVRRASDIERVKEIIHRHKKDTPLVAKIERHEAIENFDSILKAADAIMVARGDLGVELSPERVPTIQKTIIQKCNQAGKPVIVATQMLESMVDNPMPTRAEASDVANAIIDGADAIMLSGETATGNYPEEAVAVMSKISEDVERFVLRNRQNLTKSFNPIHMVADGLCYATTHTAIDIGAKLIVTYTESGRTALLISKYRPSLPIMAITVSDKISRRINLYWGVLPATISRVTSLEEVMMRSEETAIASGMVKNGDHILITAGIPFGKAGSTNIMKIQKITFVPEEASADAVKAFKTKRISMFECAENKLKLSFDRALCTSCGDCVAVCAFKIFEMKSGEVVVNEENLRKCQKDGICVQYCPYKAINIS